MLTRSTRKYASLLLLLLLAPIGAAESNEDVPLRFSAVAGEDNLPPGCINLHESDNPCHQIATSMNGLDTPKIDVLILVPVSPAAERDMRILRQSTEMWADGIDWMAEDMGLQWMADGVEFHIFMEMINTGESEFTTYPIVDPEIVIIASNPVGGIGIGVDPSDFIFGNFFGNEDIGGPCHGVANPFDHAAWEALPGFDSHHGGRSGTYVEDCDGAGGNICFSVNAAIDPDPTRIDFFQLYDLASHETGHCLTLGHVGDGAEGSWSSVPTNDIMAYNQDPPGKVKCVSSLNVEAFAVEMSKFLDTNGDGNVTPEDRYYANDAEGGQYSSDPEAFPDDRPFQMQHPDNHHYASSTRGAMECPQPDLGLTPMSEVVNFTPKAQIRETLAITNLAPYHNVTLGDVWVTGTVTNTTGTIKLGYQDQASFLDTPMMEIDHNFTADVAADGTWKILMDLSEMSHDELGFISAQWMLGEEVVDSDRVFVTGNASTPFVPLEVPADEEAIQNTEAPGPALVFLIAALGAVIIARRR